jgi:hypothetical protein
MIPDVGSQWRWRGDNVVTAEVLEIYRWEPTPFDGEDGPQVDVTYRTNAGHVRRKSVKRFLRHWRSNTPPIS